jgi:NAD(P)H-hydrate epimerase
MSNDILWTRAEARAFDRRMIEEVGIPGVVLMENAGAGAARWILENRGLLGVKPEAMVGVLCGRGNNGGDGYVLARHLWLAGQSVAIYELGEPEGLSPDASIFRGVCLRVGLNMARWVNESPPSRAHEVSCWVDAVLGSGFTPPLREDLVDLFSSLELIRSSSGAPLVALDCPSGLDIDTGNPAPGSLKADFTLTFGATKAGFQSAQAASSTGRVSVVSLGVPVATPEPQ